MSDSALREEAGSLGLEARRKGFRPDLIGRLFAIVREASARTIGLEHFDTQLMGGLILLKGMIAEMETGEGKTLTATLAAGAAALAGMPVHVICVNDYLTARDAEAMAPVYKALGLSVGCVVHDRTLKERQAAYGCQVTYCTNKEVVFDYLRDRLVLGQMTDNLRLQAEYLHARDVRDDRLLLRGLHFGICDEADSILIDEARTPLIISGAGEGKEEEIFLRQAMSLSKTLIEGADYSLDRDRNRIDLTDEGIDRIRKESTSLGPLWSGAIRRDETIRKALAALHLFQADIHYLVREGKVQIVDEYTGRLMPDRSWERGIHQLIEIKEGCELTRQVESIARITYQRFFRRYLHLCGMTGTAWEVRKELWSVYGLAVARVPTVKPLRRSGLPGLVAASAVEKRRAVLERVEGLFRGGRPVLIGTRSVAASEELSARFTHAGLEHRVLNAKNDREEAEIVAEAGRRGAVTIATNMAGRGTDIKLGPGVAELGGLHVILTERHDAGRIDRQLAGRCGRQGDPGSFEAILSMEDSLLEGGRAGVFGWAARHIPRPGAALWTLVSKIAILHAQRRMERVHARARRELLKQDERMGTLLSFSGSGE
jgi:preprotein translocase subunit SecA